VRPLVVIAVVVPNLALGIMLGLLFPPETLRPAKPAPTKGMLATSPPVAPADQKTRAPEPSGTHELDKLPSAATEETKEQVKATSEPERPETLVTKATGQRKLKRTNNPAEKASKRGRHPQSERAARANRDRYAAPERPQRSIVSQLPIVGPVFGLFVP